MARAAGRRLSVLLGTTVAGAATASSAITAMQERRPWGSSYLALGMRDRSVIANRTVMNKLYVEDVRKLRDVVPEHPQHVPLTLQPAYALGGRARLRILSWNINILCGPDGSASVGGLRRIDPDLVADVIKHVNADIVCLQETIDWIPPKFKDYLEKQGVGELDVRMRRLNAHLRKQGFETVLRSCAPPSTGNPVLVASRIPVLHEETCQLAPSQAKANGMECPRQAAYVEVGVTERGNATIGVYATHLHHINYASNEGQRAAEIESLLDHAKARQKRNHRIATIATGDFNQARQQDYTADEWAVVAEALGKVRQPENDGVFEALQKARFTCSYDAAPLETNFGGRRAPAFTHWTGTTVDYLYMLDERKEPGSASGKDRGHAEIAGSYVVFSDLSDHLPIITDIALDLPAPLQCKL